MDFCRFEACDFKSITDVLLIKLVENNQTDYFKKVYKLNSTCTLVPDGQAQGAESEQNCTWDICDIFPFICFVKSLFCDKL